MLRYVYANDLYQYPQLAASMFRDRADQFKTRLGWEVSVDEHGFEKDQYDELNPLYVIWENADGSHGGSMRFLPTTGRTMVNEHFSHVIGGGEVRSPLIWECTRFCLSRTASSRMAALLVVACGEVMHHFNVEHFVGVFDARMVRIYRMLGASPDVLGRDGAGRDQVSVGLWHYDAADRNKVLRRAGVSLALSQLWFDRSFGADDAQDLAQSA
ncbi:Acyl-homoserine-lactone synthase [Ascidiaceihabitans donghaensis]|uniref:Acyl-homoserine-lactone synthase n=1 Tax=Ascidiaceihabitans donghaensis TaxID=1510460 RepID=A0A2R8BB61_9RHOB|nr:acyl-homoserine-lactone synthase [Ascidiaceihabitans donghaensis]SPH20257.1 Acyl-homoserine-lactone synthase [Ascidiaceihabitans donghaensis]